jgi:hypothetical protein
LGAGRGHAGATMMPSAAGRYCLKITSAELDWNVAIEEPR